MVPDYAAASPLPEKSIPQSVDWFAHLDVEQLKSSRVGAVLFEELKSVDPLKNNPQLPINPILLIDGLRGLTTFGTMPDLKNPGPDVDVVLLIDGTPELVQVFRGLISGFRLEQPEAIEETNHSGHAILSMNQAGISGIFMEDGRVALSKSLGSLKGFLSAHTGQSGHLEFGQKFPLPALDQGLGVYLGVFVDGLGGLQDLPVQARILRLTEAVALQLGESGDNLHLLASLITDQPETAQQVQEVLRGIIAMMILTQNGHPDVATLVESARVHRVDNAVALKVDYPAASAEKWVRLLTAKIAEQMAPKEEREAEGEAVAAPADTVGESRNPGQGDVVETTPSA